METHTGALRAVDVCRFNNIFVTGGDDKKLCFWDSNSKSQIHSYPLGARVTSIACSAWSYLMVVGLDTGEILSFDIDEAPRLIMQSRVHSGPVKQVGTVNFFFPLIAASLDCI
jgi:WD40 repeat protein